MNDENSRERTFLDMHGLRIIHLRLIPSTVLPKDISIVKSSGALSAKGMFLFKEHTLYGVQLREIMEYVAPYINGGSYVEFSDMDYPGVYRYVFEAGKAKIVKPMWNEPDSIKIKTESGEVSAYLQKNAPYPGICLMFKPNGCDCEVDLVYTESRKSEDNKDKKQLYLYVYGDEYSEEYTQRLCLDVDKFKESFE